MAFERYGDGIMEAFISLSTSVADYWTSKAKGIFISKKDKDKQGSEQKRKDN